MFLKNYTYLKIFVALAAFIFFFSGINAQTVTKTYNPAASICYDGNGNYGSAVGSVNFAATDFTGCSITELDVIIRFAKSDGVCPNPTGTGNSWHDETSFRIQGPTGTQVNLVQPGSYSGNASTFLVTVRFNQGSTAVSGTPSSGTFGPNGGNLNNFNGTNPVGNWTLYAGDNTPDDPLVIDYFQVIATASGGRPAAQGFGCNQWNVNAYRGRDWNLGGGTTMYGYYTEPNLSFDTRNRWASGSTPAAASGYVGCDPGIDNHTVVSKRTCFPCANYRIDVPNHDDEVKLFINGSEVWSEGNCCLSHTNVWNGILENSSTVEIRHGEGGGGSHHGLTLTDITAALNPGSHATNAVTGCVGADYGNLNANAASGGTTSGVTGGSTTYQWQVSYNGGAYSNEAGATSEDYNIPALNATGTYDFRRRVTDRCGNVAYTTPRRYNIVDDPSITVAIAPTNVCPGEGTTLTATTTGGTGTCTYVWQSSPDNIVWSTMATNSSNIYTVGAAVSTTYYRVQRNCTGFGCNDPNSNVVSLTVEDNTDPVIANCPTNITMDNSAGNCGANVSWTEPTATDNCAPSTYRTNGIDFTLLGIYNGSYYYISDDPLVPAGGSNAAQQAAMASANQAGLNLGGSLVDIADASENKFLESVITSNVLIGYTDELVEGNFGWFSGAPTTYTNWNGGEPNNAGGEDYTEFTTNGSWNDVDINLSNRRFVIETATVPPTLFNNNFDPGDFFPVGTTTVTYTADDGNGNTATCSFDVTVNDVEDPQITCPANMSITNAVGNCTAVVNYAAPTSSDNCPGESVVQTAGLASGDTYPIGTTTNEFEVTDAAGNTATCSFDIVVALDGAPLALVLTSPTACLGDGVLVSQSGGTPVQGSNPGDNGIYAGLGVTNNPDGTFDFDPTATGTGTHTISYTYEDGGGCSLFITEEIEVFESPIASLTCPEPILRDCEGPFNCNPTDLNPGTITIASGAVSGSAAPYTYGNPNPGGDLFIDFPNVPTDTPLELIYTVTTSDGCSSSTSCTFEVTGKQANAGKY